MTGRIDPRTPTYAVVPRPPDLVLNTARRPRSHEDQGTAYDSGATGHELQGRRPPPIDAICPVCGTPVPFKVAAEIEAIMDENTTSCPRCASTFGEQRREI